MKPRPFHHQRPLAAAAAFYGTGVWAGVTFPWRPWIAISGLAVSVILTFLLPKIGRRRLAGVFCVFLFLGMLWGGFRAHPSLPDEGKYRVTGVAAADVVLRENGTAAGYLERAVLSNELGERRVARLYWTYTPGDPDAALLPKEGDCVTLTGKIYHPSGRVNPYGFDFRLYLLQKGVTVGLSGDTGLSVTGHPGRGVQSLLYRVKTWLLNRVRAIFGPDSALPEALLLGARDDLPEETERGFIRSGTAHLLAVSGLHVSLLAGLLLIPLRRLLSPGKRLAALSAFLLFYCALLGFSAPVARASLLMVFAGYRRVVRRSPDPLTTLCAAILLILFVRPLDLFSASFQLSFCAVLGLVAYGEIGPAEKERPGRVIWNAWRSTTAATLGAALPGIQIFHRVSFLGLLVNPPLCASFAALLSLYAGIVLVGCVSLPAGVYLAGFINPVTRGFIRCVEWLGQLPFASVRVPYLPWYCVLSAALAGILGSRYVDKPWRIKLAAAVLALAVSFTVWRGTLCRDLQYIQLAMGQSDAALVLDKGETAVIDTGSYGGDVASYLLSTDRRADHLILTHLHTDHCGGVRQLLDEEVPIGQVYLPFGAEEQQIDESALSLLEELRSRGIPIVSLAAGDTLLFPRASMTVTWPQRDAVRPGQDANRYSLCALWDLDGLTILTTGDLTGDYEGYAALDADILKVAHHGSKNSTGEAFLREVSPQIAVIPDQDGSAVLPHPDTLCRLQNAGCQVFRTGECGAVTVTVRGGEGTVQTYLIGGSMRE